MVVNRWNGIRRARGSERKAKEGRSCWQKDQPRKAYTDGYPEKGSVAGPKGLVESIITRILQRKLPMFYKLSIITTVETKIMVEISQKFF